MKIKEVSYGRTFNIGSYESERIDLTAELEDNEDEITVITKLRAKIEEVRIKSIK
uniref:Uncharacterized protein n=1 Tax=viral metagenome TaxID=1070528 RepID=A0A6M3LUC6_9ZZZZ